MGEGVEGGGTHCISMGRYVLTKEDPDPVSILYKSIAGRYRPVMVADGPKTAR